VLLIEKKKFLAYGLRLEPERSSAQAENKNNAIPKTRFGKASGRIVSSNFTDGPEPSVVGVLSWLFSPTRALNRA
jgi:hypothetical protein